MIDVGDATDDDGWLTGYQIHVALAAHIGAELLREGHPLAKSLDVALDGIVAELDGIVAELDRLHARLADG